MQADSKIFPTNESSESIHNDKFNDLAIKVNAAREALIKYVESNGNDKYVDGLEGRAVKYFLATLDKDGNGTIAQKEFDQFLENSSKTIDNTLGFLLNAGVVAALILSIVAGLSLSELTPSDSSQTYFGDTIIKILQDIFYFLLSIIFGLCLVVIYSSTRLYIFLGFWICTDKAKSQYLAEAPLAVIAIGSIWIMNLFAVALPVGMAVTTSPIGGLFGLFSTIFVFFLISTYFEVTFGKKAGSLALAETKELLGSTKKSE